MEPTVLGRNPSENGGERRLQAARPGDTDSDNAPPVCHALAVEHQHTVRF